MGDVPADPAVNLMESEPELGVIVMAVGALGATGVTASGPEGVPPKGSRYKR